MLMMLQMDATEDLTTTNINLLMDDDPGMAGRFTPLCVQPQTCPFVCAAMDPPVSYTHLTLPTKVNV